MRYADNETTEDFNIPALFVAFGTAALAIAGVFALTGTPVVVAMVGA